MHDRGEASRAAALSIVAALLLTSMKLISGVISNSIGLISEALHSGLDLVAAGITFVAVNKASQAPDDEHQYGHGKIENFSALAETIILWITAVWIIYEAVRRIIYMEFAEPTLLGIGVMLTSIIVDYERSRMLYHTAEKFNSQALEADALHFSTDMLSSVVVLIGLGFLWLGFPLGDPMGAIGVSIIIFFISFRLAKRSYDQLVDRAPSGIEEEVRQICREIPGVIDCTRVRARHSGPHIFVDVVVQIESMRSIDDAHSIADLLEERIERTTTHAIDCVVHIEPEGVDTQHERKDQVFSKLMQIAKAHPKIDSVHNVRILHLDNGVHILADLEMNPSLTIQEAHEISDDFENQVKRSINDVQRITVHLESTETTEPAYEITKESDTIIKKVKEVITRVAPECTCKSVSVTENTMGFTITVDCGIQGETTLTIGHEQAEIIKREIEKEIPSSTAMIHMEPI